MTDTVKKIETKFKLKFIDQERGEIVFEDTDYITPIKEFVLKDGTRFTRYKTIVYFKEIK